MSGYRVTAQDILSCAVEIIEQHGWQRAAWPHHGPAPRCIRAALTDALIQLDDNPLLHRKSLQEAMSRVSEAIYDKPGAVGGILDWEYRRRTDKAAVIAVLRKAIDLTPQPPKTPRRVV